MDRPITTLFMLMSVDGKISTGATDELDVDRDFPKIPGVREGLHQYYEIEQTTDLWSFNTGRVQAKMGVNEKEMSAKTPVSFVLLDNHHLTEHGVRYFCAISKQAVVITLIDCSVLQGDFSNRFFVLHNQKIHPILLRPELVKIRVNSLGGVGIHPKIPHVHKEIRIHHEALVVFVKEHPVHRLEMYLLIHWLLLSFYQSAGTVG